MLDLRAEVRQSGGEVKPRNVRGRCQKTTTSGRAVAANMPSCRTYCARLDALCRVMQQYISSLLATESNMPERVWLGIYLAAMIALIVSGCILTRKPKRGL